MNLNNLHIDFVTFQMAHEAVVATRGRQPEQGPDVDPAYETHCQLQAQETWTENVKAFPKLYNFAIEGACNGGVPVVNGGGVAKCMETRVNFYGRCERCQHQLESDVEAAEEAAGWLV